MLGIEAAAPYGDQPIQATTLGQTRKLTSWITPDSLEIQNKYEELTEHLSSLNDKIMACLQYVCAFPYTRFVRVETKVAGKRFVENDTWLAPDEAMYAPKINCVNRSFLLTSLLRQELPADRIFTVFGNLNTDHQDGHAWVYAKLNQDYVLEPTSRVEKAKFIPLDVTEHYEDIVYVSDADVVAIPDRAIREPFSDCFNCICWLGDYIEEKLCCR